MTELRRTEMHQVATSAVHTKIRYPRFILYPGRTFLLAVVHEETVCRDPLQLKRVCKPVQIRVKQKLLCWWPNPGWDALNNGICGIFMGSLPSNGWIWSIDRFEECRNANPWSEGFRWSSIANTMAIHIPRAEVFQVECLCWYYLIQISKRYLWNVYTYIYIYTIYIYLTQYYNPCVFNTSQDWGVWTPSTVNLSAELQSQNGPCPSIGCCGSSCCSCRVRRRRRASACLDAVFVAEISAPKGSAWLL